MRKLEKYTLSDELGQRERGGEVLLQRKDGECRYCKQTAWVRVPKEWEKEKINEYVTEICDCDLGEFYRKIVELVGDEAILGAAVDVGNGVKAQITMTSKEKNQDNQEESGKEHV